MGVSPRRLEGWEPATVTTVHRDSQGRVISEVTVREREFDRSDLARLINARRSKTAARGAHGYPLEEATDPKKAAEMAVRVPTQDLYADKFNKAQEYYRKTYGDTVDHTTLLWELVPKNDPDVLRMR